MKIQTTTILRRPEWPYYTVGRLEMAWDGELLLNKGLIHHSEDDWKCIVLLLQAGARKVGIEHTHFDVERKMDKILSDMTDEEIIAEINALRDRRAQARERKVATNNTPKEKKGPEEITGAAADLLKDILGDL